jgi:hypothetical protein
MPPPPNYNTVPLDPIYSSKTIGNNTIPSGYPSLGQNTVPLPANYPIRGYVPPGPSAPGNVLGTQVGVTQSVGVTFNLSDTNGGTAITKYTVTTNPGNIIKDGAGSPINVDNLSYGTPYTFSVTATNTLAQTSPPTSSQPVTLTTTPSAPTNVSKEEGNGEVTIKYDVPSSDGGLPIDTYKVTCTTDSSITIPNRSVSPGQTPDIIIRGLTNGTTYTFNICAHNAKGDSGPASINVTPMFPNRFYETNLYIDKRGGGNIIPGDFTNQPNPKIYLDNITFTSKNYYINNRNLTYHNDNDKGYLFIITDNKIPFYIANIPSNDTSLSQGSLTFRYRSSQTIIDLLPYIEETVRQTQTLVVSGGTAITTLTDTDSSLYTHLSIFKEMRIFKTNLKAIFDAIGQYNDKISFTETNFPPSFKTTGGIPIYYDNLVYYDDTTPPTVNSFLTPPTTIDNTYFEHGDNSKRFFFILDKNNIPTYIYTDGSQKFCVIQVINNNIPYSGAGVPSTNLNWQNKINIKIINPDISGAEASSTIVPTSVTFSRNTDTNISAHIDSLIYPKRNDPFVPPTHYYGLNLLVKDIDNPMTLTHCDLSKGDSTINRCPQYLKNVLRIFNDAGNPTASGPKITKTTGDNTDPTSVPGAIHKDQPFKNAEETRNIANDRIYLINRKTNIGTLTTANFNTEIYYQGATGLPSRSTADNTKLFIQHNNGNYYKIEPVTGITTLYGINSIFFKDSSGNSVKLNYTHDNIWKISSKANNQILYVMLYKQTDASKKAIKITEALKTADAGVDVFNPVIAGGSYNKGFHKTRKHKSNKV